MCSDAMLIVVLIFQQFKGIVFLEKNLNLISYKLIIYSEEREI